MTLKKARISTHTGVPAAVAPVALPQAARPGGHPRSHALLPQPARAPLGWRVATGTAVLLRPWGIPNLQEAAAGLALAVKAAPRPGARPDVGARWQGPEGAAVKHPLSHPPPAGKPCLDDSGNQVPPSCQVWPVVHGGTPRTDVAGRVSSPSTVARFCKASPLPLTLISCYTRSFLKHPSLSPHGESLSFDSGLFPSL